jgi:hypothetical protein
MARLKKHKPYRFYVFIQLRFLGLWNRQTGALIWATPTPFWNKATWTIRILYIWLALVFLVFFLPCLNWFDRGRVWYLRKPNRYIHLYQIPGVDRWLPPE